MGNIKQVLTIAGSDSGGGAGIQADIKTFQELGVYSTSVITAVTAQNTLGLTGIYPMDRTAVENQLKAIGTDFQISALKTGMLFNADIIEEAARGIKKYGWQNVIVDPVMIAKGGASLLQQEAVDALMNCLLRLATVVTPNIPEAEVLSGLEIHDSVSRLRAAKWILATGAEAVVIKGGHGTDINFTEDFYLHRNGDTLTMRSPRIHTNHTHGTGCTFSAALTAELAKGNPLQKSLYTAKQFIQAAISHPLNIGAGHGPTNHAAYHKFGTKEEVQLVQ
ncbi:bifunctional hydroxymethylpyrimidine kinase/phosphomethylpyrimidine kinase [Psychrobacillus psychrodurans]|jgi:hydroxymethylpyrimidine/phosphomethylpyrimidine kinase|uniref:bifunctional hydroxymethylpyrimidine kinase/phosphomethylpyrimidine kinase n=1 Tax=Psychrobacillus TaxID=1221880 RepID=UPI0008E22BCE|nr:bifunctional hydroxymethylpyrimidine kinase/phosphomethylpyrimidine kinase [Psychrobacillus psychrodurans]MCK1997851.1 bifunctional hydroxymethylpyrimidine kinase/phosphomethylpyrimidine kinase [Psychrobacillus psychrodurans]MCZ8541034.1 bifunctional hydroxymethylpyrimidine kinase/phosphomethylpyrimidine kinase [Psychrobacillus psychrodurans]SFM83150.1 hydroxymethylpyrimidine/phosphomethylpyrimidine kinase [Psychrobacillus psychrodurans]